MEAEMTHETRITWILPGFGPDETVTSHVDNILDFASFYCFPDYQILAQELARIEQEHGQKVFLDLPMEDQEFLTSAQWEVVNHSFIQLYKTNKYDENVEKFQKRIQESPPDNKDFLRMIHADATANEFQRKFKEELDDYIWYHRIIGSFIWKSENWIGYRLAQFCSLFMRDMIIEIEYWKKARDVSIGKIFL